MTSCERVLTTINHETPVRIPCDIRAVHDVVDGPVAYLAKSDPEEVYQDLGLDFRNFEAIVGKEQAPPERFHPPFYGSFSTRTLTSDKSVVAG